MKEEWNSKAVSAAVRRTYVRLGNSFERSCGSERYIFKEWGEEEEKEGENLAQRWSSSLMLCDPEFVAHVVPDLLPDDETPAFVADVAAGLDQGDDGTAVTVLALPVDHGQLVAVMELLLLSS